MRIVETKRKAQGGWSAEVREKLAADGAEPVGGTSKELAAFVRSEIAKWAKVVKAAGLRAE